MFEPHVGQASFEVVQVQQKTENELIARDGLAGDDEREGKLDGKVESYCIVRCTMSAPDYSRDRPQPQRTETYRTEFSERPPHRPACRSTQSPSLHPPRLPNHPLSD